jgi:hypothetical protein
VDSEAIRAAKAALGVGEPRAPASADPLEESAPEPEAGEDGSVDVGGSATGEDAAETAQETPEGSEPEASS